MTGSEKTARAHAWQALRQKCVALAATAGAKDDALIELAGKISDFIMTPSEREKKSEESFAEKPKD